MERYYDAAAEGEAKSSNNMSVSFEPQGAMGIEGILLEKQVLSYVLLAVAQDISLIASTYKLRPTDYGEIDLWKPFQDLQHFFSTHQDATCFLLTAVPSGD